MIGHKYETALVHLLDRLFDRGKSTTLKRFLLEQGTSRARYKTSIRVLNTQNIIELNIPYGVSHRSVYSENLLCRRPGLTSTGRVDSAKTSFPQLPLISSLWWELGHGTVITILSEFVRKIDFSETTLTNQPKYNQFPDYKQQIFQNYIVVSYF